MTLRRPVTRVPSRTLVLLCLFGVASLAACGGLPTATTPDGASAKPDGAPTTDGAMAERDGSTTPDSVTSSPDGTSSTPDGGSSDVVETAPIIAPPPKGPGIQATAVSSGNRHGCAILLDETAACWGSNTFGELGDGSSHRLLRAGASRVTGLAGVRQLGITTGWFCDESGVCWPSATTCALQKDGVAKCWGPGLYGQLGNGKQGAAYFEDDPVTVALSDIVDLGVGDDSACAATKAGEVWCWGRNDGGQLGFTSPPCGPFYRPRADTQPPPQTVACASTPQRVPGLTGITRVAVANGRQCALHADGHVSCWGSLRPPTGFYGAPPPNGPAAVPTTVAGVTAVDIAVANDFSCAARVDRTLACWDSSFGALTPFTNVTGLRRIRAFSQTAIGFLTDGTVQQWSSNTSSPGYADTRGPDRGALDLAFGRQTCVVRADHGVRCWDDTANRSDTEAPVLAQ